MEDFMNALYLYAQEKRISRYLQTSEYRRAVHGLEEGWDTFRAALTEEQRRTLEELLLQESQTLEFEKQAFFRAGMSAGLCLGRI